MGQKARVQKNRNKVKGVAIKRRNAPSVKPIVLKDNKKKRG